MDVRLIKSPFFFPPGNDEALRWPESSSRSFHSIVIGNNKYNNILKAFEPNQLASPVVCCAKFHKTPNMFFSLYLAGVDFDSWRYAYYYIFKMEKIVSMRVRIRRNIFWYCFGNFLY